MTKVARGSRLKVSKIVQFAQSSLRDTILYCKSNYIRTPQCRRYWSSYRENDTWMYIAVRIFFSFRSMTDETNTKRKKIPTTIKQNSIVRSGFERANTRT